MPLDVEVEYSGHHLYGVFPPSLFLFYLLLTQPNQQLKTKQNNLVGVVLLLVKEHV